MDETGVKVLSIMRELSKKDKGRPSVIITASFRLAGRKETFSSTNLNRSPKTRKTGR